MKKIIVPVIILFLLLSIVAYGADFGSDSKIGLIDVSQIKRNSITYQKLEEEVDKLRDELEDYKGKVLSEHTLELNKLTKEYKTNLEEKNEEESNKLKTEYQKNVKELAAKTQKKIDKKQRELEMVQEKKNLAFNTEMDDVITNLVKKKKLSCVVHKSRVTAGGRDITEDVIKKIDKEYLPSFWERVLGIKKKPQQESTREESN